MQVAVLLLPAAVLAVLGWTHRWTADDAFINFRIVDQVLAGNGPVFNVGERVEAFTSALWLFMLAGASGVLRFVDLEWIAVVLGLSLGVFGVGAAAYGAMRLAAANGRHGFAVPAGALVFVALPPVWDFATSGLETGLSFAWLGGTFLALAFAHDRTDLAVRGRLRISRQGGLAFLVGLGTLVRPDLALFSVAFFIVLVAMVDRGPRRTVLRLAATAAAVPVVFQIFRMGYFGAMVPNTAIAKEASASYWSQGFAYFWDTFGTYWLFLPMVGLLGWGLWTARLDWLARRRPAALLAVAPMVAGAVNVVFVVKVGGDFMHGRLLLPPILGMLLPVATLPVHLRGVTAGLAAAVCVWAAVCAAGLRTEYDNEGSFSPRGISDERAFYAGSGNPVTIEDYAQHPWAQAGQRLRRRSEEGRRVLTFDAPQPPGAPIGPDRALREDLPVPVVAAGYNIGLTGYAAGTDVWLVDRLGLADPIAARVFLHVRGRPGHEKGLDEAWVVARFGDPANAEPAVAAARNALACEREFWGSTGRTRLAELRETLEAVSAPLTPRRFVKNIMSAGAATSFRLPGNPFDAERDLCARYPPPQ